MDDREVDPRPATPSLDQKLLQGLLSKDPNLVPPSFPIKNKHIYQLFELKKAGDATWQTVVEWLQLLISSFPAGDNSEWNKKISVQWRALMDRKKKSCDSSPCDKWSESAYVLPSIKGHKSTVAVPEPNPSSLAIEITKLQNKKLVKENEALKAEVLGLRSRPSGHQQSQLVRRVTRYKATAKQLRNELALMSKRLGVIEAKFQNNKLKRKRLSSRNRTLQQKVKKLEDERSTVCHSKAVDTCTLRTSLTKYRNMCEARQERINKLLQNNAEAKAENDNLHDLQRKSRHVRLKDKKGRFSPPVQQCMWNLLDAHVDRGDVVRVIKAVLEMVGLTLDDSETSGKNTNAQQLRTAEEEQSNDLICVKCEQNPTRD